MSIRNKLTEVALSLALLATFGIVANSQDATTTEKAAPHSKAGGMRRGGRGHHGMPMLRFIHNLNLSDAQKDQARVILQRFKTSIEPQRQALRELHSQVQEGTVSDEVREKAKSLRGEIRASMTSTHDELLTILTAEQLAQYDKMKTDMKARQEERRARRAARKAQQSTPTEPAAQ
jgi:hypothetical protein